MYEWRVKVHAFNEHKLSGGGTEMCQWNLCCLNDHLHVGHAFVCVCVVCVCMCVCVCARVCVQYTFNYHAVSRSTKL